ncbi:hypothetical protein PIB30_046828 [Stylosanthes scabra]|uniref:Ubiquitin-like protease family profile domain-containing protein n=1 Tax=Stylosanthes scabra TaxID=79078 RepID=A0ABU6UG98_9FABA|nr:hypothetical protein [Stylosanthes scabra]
MFKVFGSSSKSSNLEGDMTDNRLLSRCIEKAKTDIFISRKRTYALGWMKIIPKYVASEFNNIYTRKVDYLKRAFIPVSECDKDGHVHWYLVVMDHLAGEFILLEPRPTETQFK